MFNNKTYKQHDNDVTGTINSVNDDDDDDDDEDSILNLFTCWAKQPMANYSVNMIRNNGSSSSNKPT
jgi:hypothetical protein